jgi:hypothetical protein
MKKIILIATTLISFTGLQAQDFKATLEKTFTAFDTSWELPKKVEQSNKLSLIAKKWSNEWIAHYYAAYSKAMLSFLEKDEDKRDAYLDDADKEKENAVSILGKENDETYVLAAMIANGRLAVKPASRFQKYGKIFDDNLDKAKELNPNNPRIYLLLGNSRFYKPKMFGGGKKPALPYYEKAEELFVKEDASDIAKPHWGKNQNEYHLQECKKEDKD